MNTGFDLKLFMIVLVILGALTFTVTSAMDTGLTKSGETQENLAPPTQPTQQPIRQLNIPQGVPQGSAGGCGV